MHNKTIVLTAAQKSVASQVRHALAGRQYGDVVVIDFVKRDGTNSTLTGSIVNLIGENDKEAVVIATEKGHRSANLWAVKGMSVL